MDDVRPEPIRSAGGSRISQGFGASLFVGISLIAVACSATPSGSSVSALASNPVPVSVPVLVSSTTAVSKSPESELAVESTAAVAGVRPEATMTVAPVKVVQVLYDGGVRSGWVDAGWSPGRVVSGGPAEIDLGNGGGWLLTGEPPKAATGLEFRFRMPRDLGGVVVVSLAAPILDQTGRVVVLANNRVDADGWSSVRIPIRQLNPDHVLTSALRFSPIRKLDSPFRVKFDSIRFTTGGSMVPYGVPTKLAVGGVPMTGTADLKSTKTTSKVASSKTKSKASATSAPSPTSTDGPPAPQLITDIEMSVDCRSNVKPISPLIYGIGWAGAGNQRQTPPWDLGASANRWGGNPTSRYNWRLGNVWNTGSDYFYRNITITDTANSVDTFLANNDAHSMASAVSVPALGWVAKDATSYSFPVAEYGRQQYNDPDVADAGNGFDPTGKRLPAGSPKRTSIESTPASIAEWVKSKLKGRVTTYFVDNEPELWDSTHADVHPDAVGYDEILAKTIQYGSAIRRGDPSAVIAGPSSWGWPAYSYSGVDAKAGFNNAPDRKAHGDVPFLAWYLQHVRSYEQKNRLKLLDLLDVHFYPAADGVFTNGNDKTDAASAALRIRQVRGLWDRGYSDESWVGEPIYLIPRLRAWIDKYSPGVGISIGEWNFGAEAHMSGGLATAEALGRFGTEGVTSAYYWTAPTPGSPSSWAFRAFRNFDGRGGRFLDQSVGANVQGGSGSNENLSLFASRSAAQNKVVLVVLNTDPASERTANISLADCGRLRSFETFRYTGGSGFAVDTAYAARRDAIAVRLPPYSITVVRALTR